MSPVIDDEGRLLGVVNVIDALVALFALAILVAGIAVVGGLGSDAEATDRYATIDLGEQPAYIADRIAVGDESIANGDGDSVEISDVYVGPTIDGNATVVVRARLHGREVRHSDDRTTFEFDGEPLRLGRSVAFETGEYAVAGQVRRIGSEDPSLSIESTPVLVHANVSANTADALEVGEAFRLDGHTVATVESIQVFPAGATDRRYVVVGLELRTIDLPGSVRFGSLPVTVGSQVPFQTENYGFTGTITNRGSTEITTTETPVVLTTTVDSTTARDVNVGDAYRIADQPIVSVESVTTYGTDEPNRKRLILGATVRTREEAGSLVFGRQELRVGSEIPIRTDAYDIVGTVIRRGSLDEPGHETTRHLTVRLENVPPSRAESITTGMVERDGNDDIARIVSVDRRPAEVVLESDDGNIYLRDHPRNEDIELTVEVNARETDDGLRFKGDPVHIGDAIPFDFGSTTIRGEVVALG